MELWIECCWMLLQGQCCTAGSRTFVHADIYDEFVGKARERAMATNVGDPFGEGTELGPQVMQSAYPSSNLVSAVAESVFPLLLHSLLGLQIRFLGPLAGHTSSAPAYSS